MTSSRRPKTLSVLIAAVAVVGLTCTAPPALATTYSITDLVMKGSGVRVPASALQKPYYQAL
jgi:hypothetical protein